MASLDFFRNVFRDDPVFFDEGPKTVIKPAQAINTSSIDTGNINAYRQGVELTQQQHFDAGVVKIHAGEPGHILRKNRFGMDKNFRNDPRFEELDYFQPVRFLETQVFNTLSLSNPLTFPIITSNNDQIENYVFDGIIEPLTIRARASFFSIDIPFEAHEAKAALMGGNTDITWASDRILTVDEYDPAKQQIAYLDLVDMIDGRFPLNGFFINDKAPVTPFTDKRLPRNAPLQTSYDSTMEAALSLMTGSSDNYIPPGSRSATSGWVFDCNVNVGTDSLTFGGTCH